MLAGVLLLQVVKAVEDILYAATQEEGEVCLAAAIQELELKDVGELPAAREAEMQQQMVDNVYENGMGQQAPEDALPVC